MLMCSSAMASENAQTTITGSLSETVRENSQSSETAEDVLFTRLIHAESRGRQFGNNGNPLTSPKGAVGVAQVMPETAPEAARLAGIQWSQWRYRNDEEYNKALGRAYLNSQLEKYSGNHVLALAAYNAGPGSVDKWIKRNGDPRTGEISEKDFIKLIPFMETQMYVASILDGQTGSYRFTSTKKRKIAEPARKFEFKDTHPGFTFSLAVNRAFSANSKLVGGL